MGFNAKVMANATTADGNVITGETYNQLTLTITHTYAAGATITFYVKTGESTSRMGHVMAGELSGGVDTYTKRQWSIATGSASGVYSINIPINCAFWNIEDVNVASGTTDTLTIEARLGNV
jgi:hypothetical protein